METNISRDLIKIITAKEVNELVKERIKKERDKELRDFIERYAKDLDKLENVILERANEGKFSCLLEYQDGVYYKCVGIEKGFTTDFPQKQITEYLKKLGYYVTIMPNGNIDVSWCKNEL